MNVIVRVGTIVSSYASKRLPHRLHFPSYDLISRNIRVDIIQNAPERLHSAEVSRIISVGRNETPISLPCHLHDGKIGSKSPKLYLNRRNFASGNARFGAYKQFNLHHPVIGQIRTLSHGRILLGGALAALGFIWGLTALERNEGNLSRLLPFSNAKAQEQEEDSNSVIIEGEPIDTVSEALQHVNWWTILAPEIPLLLGAVVLALATAATSLAMPKFMGQLMNSINNGSMPNFTHMIRPALTGCALILGQALLNYSFNALLSSSGHRIAVRLQTLLFGALIRNDISSFDEGSVGELINSMSSDVNEVVGMIKHTVSMGLKSLAQIVGGAISLYMISPQLTTIMGSLIPTLVLGGTILARFLQKLSKQAQAQAAKSIAVAEESLSNIRTVRAFANEDREVERYRKEVIKAAVLSGRFGSMVGVFHAAYSIAMQSCMVFVLLYGGKLVRSGELNGGDLTSFAMYAGTLQGAMSTLSMLQGEIVRGLSAAIRVFEKINQKPKIRISGGNTLSKVRGKIQFEDVSFRYPSRPAQKVLEGLNLSLEEGKVYALVGPSGSGKSTIACLIERFYDPQSGRILLDNVDISTLDASWLRRQIAIVSQEPVLFATTIAENIRFGNPDATPEEIKHAAKLANAHKFIKQFPQGYDTVVGERGVTLSGGQKQRIAIARAILKDAKVLILDEATSALDSESEQLVQEALQRLMYQKTTLLIAHRLSTVKNADQIVVIKDGTLVESGRHDELLERSGIYAQLVATQINNT